LGIAATYLQSQPRTRLEGMATGKDLQHFTQASQWVGFVDDIAIFAYSVGAGVTGLGTQMQLRVGSGDMNVNDRRAEGLLAHVATQLEASGTRMLCP
jgi:uncharacterized protein (DUF1499 family)